MPPPPLPKTREQPCVPPLTRASQIYSPNAKTNEIQSYLHPNTAELGYDIARPSTAASNMTGSTYLDEPINTPRLRSFSSSSTLTSTAYMISSETRSPDTDNSSFSSGPPTPFFLSERPRSSYSTYSPQYQASSSVSGMKQFEMRPQSFAYAPTYHTHHANFSVASGISDMSLHSSTYSTLHQSLSAVSGFSELPAKSLRQERSYSKLAPKSNHVYPWDHDPDANAPEVVPSPQIITPTYVAYSPLGPPCPPPMPDYSIPEVVPVEHERHFDSLPQVTAHAPFHPRRYISVGLEPAPRPQLQSPSQPQRCLTQAQERREKTRARLNLIAGE